jgi:hypothetical protein
MFMIVCFLKKIFFLCGKGDNSNLNIDAINLITDKYASKTPSIDVSYQVSDRLAKRFQRRRFLEIDQSELRIACGSHVC